MHGDLAPAAESGWDKTTTAAQSGRGRGHTECRPSWREPHAWTWHGQSWGHWVSRRCGLLTNPRPQQPEGPQRLLSPQHIGRPEPGVPPGLGGGAACSPHLCTLQVRGGDTAAVGGCVSNPMQGEAHELCTPPGCPPPALLGPKMSQQVRDHWR